MAEQKAPETEKRRGMLDVLRKLRDITSLTRQEQALMICILFSLATGAVIQHYRHTYHLAHPIALPTPTPSLRTKDLYVVPTNSRTTRERDPDEDR